MQSTLQNSDLPEVTVIICTRNRAVQLGQVLTSATKMKIPSGLSWEFIVVDNGSSDNTPDVVKNFEAVLPIRCIREDKPGLSSARNCGVMSARGKYICWTDDDVVIHTEWLSSYVEAFRRHPEAAVFGGRVLPLLQPPTPDWFNDRKEYWPLNALLAHRDFGDDEMEVTFEGGKTPYGANFAVRAKEQKQLKYNLELGVSPSHKRLGEETDLIYRIFKAGGHGWWVPGSKVSHIIPPKRQTMRYIFDYSVLAGETYSYLRWKFPTNNYLLATKERHADYGITRLEIFKRIFLSGLKFSVRFVGSDKKSTIFHLRNFGFYLGMASYKPDDKN